MHIIGKRFQEPKPMPEGGIRFSKDPENKEQIEWDKEAEKNREKDKGTSWKDKYSF